MKKNTNIRKSFFAIVCALMSAVAAVAASAAADVNGDGRENNKDVIALFRYVSGDDKAENETAYDFNGDGSVNNKDVVSLFKYLSGETPKENELELFVKRADLSSYTLEETFYENGILDNRQVCEHKEGYDHLLITLNAEDEADGEYSFRQEFYTVLNEREGISDLIYERTHQHKWYGKSFDWPTYLMLARLNTREFNLIIDPSLYDRVSDNVFIAKKGCEDDAGQDFFFDNGVIDWESSDIDYYPEEFVSIKITISGSDLTVYAESVVDCAGSVTERTYEVLLCKTGVTSFDVPEYETEPKGGLPGDSISDCYDKTGGEEVYNVTGHVTAFNSSSNDDCKVYIDDGKRGMLVLLRGIGRTGPVFVGEKIAVYGRIEVKDRLKYIVVTSENDIEAIGLPEEISYASEDDFDGLYYSMVGKTVDLTGISIDRSKLGEPGGTVRVTDSRGNTLSLTVTPYDVPLFNEICKKVQPGTKFDLLRVALSLEGYDICINLTRQTKAGLKFGLLPGYTSKTVRDPVTLREALSDLELGFREEDGTHRFLSFDEYTVVCDGYKYESGVYNAVISYNGYEAVITLTVMTPAISENVSYPTLDETGLEEANLLSSLPSSGDVSVLVIPIGFENTDYEKYGTPDQIRDRLDKAFNGTKEETGWYSLCGYYRDVSYGRLNITARILDVYQTGEAYDLYSSGGSRDERYLINALKYYDGEIDYSMYDQNDDYFIDCVYMVYLAPFYDQKNTSQSDFWWAYFSTYSKDLQIFDDVYADGYIWMGYEFFDRPAAKHTGEDGKLTEEYLDINCEVLIHETGHALGLDDYYDYASGGVKGGIGSFGMMDASQGDLDPYSKAILGWINPTVVFGADCEITLRSFAETGDALIISKDFGKTYFEEYYIVALYTPTGANEYKKDMNCGLPSETGVMLWHISAGLDPDMNASGLYNLSDMTLYNNGSADIKLIDLICADGSTEIDEDFYYLVSDKDLFHGPCTVSGLEWNDGTGVDVRISIGEFTSDGGTEQAEISLKYNY